MADQFRNARLAYVKVGSDTFAAETAATLSLQADLIETTNKSSSGRTN